MSLQPPPQDDYSFFDSGSNLMRQIHVAMIRLDLKADNMASRISDLVTRHDQTHTDHEQRLRKLEERDYISPATVWKIVGLLTTLASIAIAIISASK